MKILFLTTIDVNIKSGGGAYSRSMIDAFRSQPGVVVEVVELSTHRLIRSRLVRALVAVLAWVFRRVPVTVGFHSLLLKRNFLDMLNSNHDVIIADHLEVLGVLDSHHKKKYVYVSHNVEHKLLEERLRSVPSAIRQAIVKNLRSFEEEVVSRAALNITISAVDAEWISSFSPNTVVVYPTFPPPAPRDAVRAVGDVIKIGFLGGSGWAPNRLAVDYALERVLPRLKRDFEYVLCGAGWAEYISQKALPPDLARRVVVLGHVPDLSTFWQTIDLFLGSIEHGQGTNVKVCEAIHNQVPVYALPYALRGLPVEELKEAVFFGNDDELVERINTATSHRRSDCRLFSVDSARVKIGGLLEKLSFN